jgi:rhamnosyl/mannosyltransferase
MRVLQFGKFAFASKGGIERHVEQLSRGLAAAGADVTVLAYDVNGDLRRGEVDGVKIEPIRAPLVLGSQVVTRGLGRRLAELEREAPFDVVHQHWPDPGAHWAATRMRGNAAHVATWHSDIVRQRASGAVYRAIARGFMRDVDALIFPTQQLEADSTQSRYIAPHALRRVIRFGFNAASFAMTPEMRSESLAIRRKFGDRKMVFALGRHVYYKNFATLIRAMVGVDGVLCLGGSGPLTPQLRTLAASLGAPVEFTGPIPEAQLPAYFHACDVFCLPSAQRAETFGFVQAEAMACAKPIVNTWLHNGVNELAPDGVCACTVAAGDPSALAGAISQLFANDALARRLGAGGQARIRAEFTVAGMVEETLSLYREVVARRRQMKA